MDFIALVKGLAASQPIAVLLAAVFVPAVTYLTKQLADGEKRHMKDIEAWRTDAKADAETIERLATLLAMRGQNQGKCDRAHR